MSASQAGKIDEVDVTPIGVADIVISVKRLDFGEVRIASGTPGFVVYIDTVNYWYHVLWNGVTCLVSRYDIARLF